MAQEPGLRHHFPVVALRPLWAHRRPTHHCQNTGCDDVGIAGQSAKKVDCSRKWATGLGSGASPTGPVQRGATNRKSTNQNSVVPCLGAALMVTPSVELSEMLSETVSDSASHTASSMSAVTARTSRFELLHSPHRPKPVAAGHCTTSLAADQPELYGSDCGILSTRVLLLAGDRTSRTSPQSRVAMGGSALRTPRASSRSRAGRDANVGYRPSLSSGAAHEVLRQPEVAR
jgi:hypothetical protein